MIVEFTGAPGSGKSTIAAEMPGLLQKGNLSALPVGRASLMLFQRLTQRWAWPSQARRLFWRPAIVWQGIRFSFEHPSLTRLVISSQRTRSTSWRLRIWILGRLLDHWGQYRLLQKYMDLAEIATLDGGLAHLAVALFTSEQQPPSVETIASYVQLLPVPDLLVVVDVPVEVCVERVKGRPRSLPRRLQGLDEHSVVAFVRYQAEAVSRVADEAQRCGWELIRIDNTAPLPRVLECLRVKVVQWEATRMNVDSGIC